MNTRTNVRSLREDLGEWVARHDQPSDLSEFAGYAEDPVGFIRDVLGGEPWGRQVEIAESVRDEPLVVVRSANAVGKDWTAARLALWWVYARRGLALVTGPTERQVREVVMGEVARAFRRAPDLPGELFTSALRLPGDEAAGILAFTSTEASRLTGFHAPRVMAMLTEAQAVEGFAWEGLLACATGSSDRVLAVGNPLSPSGRFYAASRSSAWLSVAISAEDHPNLQEAREVIPGGPSRAFVDRIRQEYGEDSGIYAARVLGQFPEDAEEGLVKLQWLEAAAERHARFRRWQREPDPGPVVVGVDVARYGSDRTILAVRRGDVLEELKRLPQGSTMETTGHVLRELRRIEAGQEYVGRDEWEPHGLWRPREPPKPGRRRAQVVVDEAGLGGGVVDRLREQGRDVLAFNSSFRPERSLDRERFLNLRAVAFWKLRKLLERGELTIPHHDDLWRELQATTWKIHSSGKIQIEGKDAIRSALGRSPDYADAVAMAAWAGPEPATVSFDSFAVSI